MLIIAATKEFFQKGILNRMDDYSKMIAHQMMQPVTQTSLTASHLKDVLSDYKEPSIKEDGDEYYLVKKEDFVEVQNTIKSFEQTSKSNEKMVKGILSVAKSDIENAKDIGIYDIGKCLKEALLIYNDKALSRLSINKVDSFKFKGSLILITEVLLNIINNSLNHAGGKAKIQVWFENNSVHIKDNGKSISEDKLEHLFTLVSQSSGLGLPFCKRVMEAIGGSITCNSKLGKYTEFVIGFPKA